MGGSNTSHSVSDQRIVIFPANRNRNRFAEQISVQIGIVCEFQNLKIGIILVRWEVFTNNSQIPDIFFFLNYMSKKFFFLTLIFFSFEKFTGQTKP